MLTYQFSDTMIKRKMQSKLIFMDTYCSFVKKTSLSDRCICDYSKMDGCSFIYSVLKIKPVASSGMAVRFDVID